MDQKNKILVWKCAFGLGSNWEAILDMSKTIWTSPKQIGWSKIILDLDITLLTFRIDITLKCMKSFAFCRKNVY